MGNLTDEQIVVLSGWLMVVLERGGGKHYRGYELRFAIRGRAMLTRSLEGTKRGAVGRKAGRSASHMLHEDIEECGSQSCVAKSASERKGRFSACISVD